MSDRELDCIDEKNIESERDRRWEIFWHKSFWAINALTTFAFGMRVVSTVLWPFFWGDRLSIEAKEFIVPLLGGVIAILVFDGGYEIWGWMRSKRCTTLAQLVISNTLKWASQSLSLSYSVIELILLFYGENMPPESRVSLEEFGVWAFIIMFMCHLLAFSIFISNGLEARRRDAEIRINSRRESSRLRAQNKIYKNALATASAEIMKSVPDIGKKIGLSWERDVMAEYSDVITDAPPPIVDSSLDPVVEKSPEPTEGQLQSDEGVTNNNKNGGDLHPNVLSRIGYSQ